jgi:hypothetical protein
VSRCRKSLFRSSLTLSSWLHVRDLEHLSPKQITEFLSGAHRRTSGDLKEGYEIAQDPTEWDAEQKELLEERENAANQVDELEDDDEEEADTSATKRKKATKEKSKKKAKISKVSLIVFVSSGLGQDGFGQIS